MRVGVSQLQQVSSTLGVMSFFFTLSIQLLKNVDVWQQLHAPYLFSKEHDYYVFKPQYTKMPVRLLE